MKTSWSFLPSNSVSKWLSPRSISFNLWLWDSKKSATLRMQMEPSTSNQYLMKGFTWRTSSKDTSMISSTLLKRSESLRSILILEDLFRVRKRLMRCIENFGSRLSILLRKWKLQRTNAFKWKMIMKKMNFLILTNAIDQLSCRTFVFIKHQNISC